MALRKWHLIGWLLVVLQNHPVMLKNYFKMAWRSLARNKVSSIINIGGLAVGLATAIIILLVVTDEFSYDKFHANLHDTYVLMRNQHQNDDITTGNSMPGPLAAAIRSDIPETKYAARSCRTGPQLLRLGDKSTFEPALYADPDFFRIMSFPALEGNPAAAMQEPGSIVLTEHVAKKFFGNDDPIGKLMVHDNKHTLKVAAVIRDVPSNSSIQFDVVLPFRLFESENTWLKKWDDNRIDTWMQLKPSANMAVLDTKLTKLIQARTGDSTQSLFAYPFSRLRMYGNFKHGQQAGGRIYMVDMLALIGLFMLLIACINFMNLATARSEHRAREVGVRKVMGASRKRIILQFYGEALIMTVLALLLAVLLVNLLLPSFNRFAEKNIRFNFLGGRLWLLLPGIGLFTALVAGSYPALFLSRFKPVKVLKGITATGKGGGLRRALVTAQFVISIFFIIATIVIYTQINYVRDRPIGYDQENLVEINASGDLAGKFDVFKNELSQVSGVTGISAGSDNILQFSGSVTGMDWPGKQPGHEISVIVSGIQYNWIKTMGLKMVEGRDFNPAFGADSTGCLINQSTVERMGLKEPVVGQIIGGKTVIGVIQNFVFNNPSGIIAPMQLSLNTHPLSHFFIRVQNDGHWRQTLAQVEKTAKKLNPDYPFNFSFVKEGYQERFEEFASFGQLATLFGGMAIFISCLGLFGLSAFMAERRGKEMSIRKVLGASVLSVWFSLSKDFLKPVFIAFLLAAPVALWVMDSLLALMVYHIELTWWMFATGGLLATIVALLTVSYQGIRSALENPVKSLRAE